MGTSNGKASKKASSPDPRTPAGRQASTDALKARMSQRAIPEVASVASQSVGPDDRPRKKIVLLGAGDSGKSTISKQIKLLQLGGYSRKEVHAFVPIIRNNAVLTVRAFLEEVDKDVMVSIVGSDTHKEVKNAIAIVKSAQALNDEVREAISVIWLSQKIQSGWKGRLNTKEATRFFVSNLDRIVGPGYAPTSDDILRARAKTTGIIELSFSYSGYDITIIDVGGQRSERKKWEQCFVDVNAIIWCASLSEYDEMLYEDAQVNRMHESLELFESAVKSNWFSKTDVIIFFNKEDLFRQKIAEIDLKACFENYNGGRDPDKALAFIKKEYEKRAIGVTRVFSVVLTATDSASVHKALGKVISVVVEDTLKANIALPRF